MIDNNGSNKYSNVIILRESGTSLTLTAIKPNPFRNNIVLSLFLTARQEVKITLVDAAGRIVNTTVQHGEPGLNNFYLNSLDLLPAGMYSVRIGANGSLYQEKMIKTAY
jgi:hypothetical protein